MHDLRRTVSPLSLGLTLAALACSALVGNRLGRAWLAGRAVEPPVTAAASARPPVLAAQTSTLEAKQAEPEPTLEPAIGPQLNVAVVVVDSLDAPEPALQAVWIAALHTEQKTAFLLGISPYLWVTTPGREAQRLRDAYEFDPANGSGGPDFELALHRLSYAPLLGTITVDALLLSEVVNRLGGVDLSGTRMDGASAVAHTLMGAPPDPLLQSRRQTDFAYALRDSAAASLTDAGPYLELLLERGRTNISPEVLGVVALAFTGYNPATTAIAPPVADPQLIVLAPDGEPAVRLSQDEVFSAGPASFAP